MNIEKTVRYDSFPWFIIIYPLTLIGFVIGLLVSVIGKTIMIIWNDKEFWGEE